MKFFILVFLFSLSAFSQGVDDPFKVKPDNAFTQEDLKLRKEVLLQDNELIEDLDKVVGVKNSDHFTKWDKTRLSISIQTAADITKIAALSSFDFKFQKKIEHYSSLWWHVLAKKTIANFDQVTENPTLDASAPSGSDRSSLNQRPETTQQDILQIGGGIGYRFKFLFPWREVKNVFEEIHFTFNYTTNLDAFSGNDYAGYGIITEYEIYKRTSKKFFYGGKLTYNISDVTRKVPSNYDLNDGRLLLSWMTLGFNMGFFF